MLINCPECGKQVSDKSEVCINCGYPISKHVEELNQKKKEENKPKCPYCNSTDIDKNGYCNDCGMNTNKNKKKGFIDGLSDCLLGMVGQEPMEDKKVVVSKNKEFQGIYKYNLFGEKKEVYCPRCNSERCSHYTQQQTIPEKTKTRYTANLNPLKPFTLVNKKEKIVRKEQTYTENKIICNDCGYIFF